MEGKRLILKRHVPRGRQRLAVLIALGGIIALVVLLLQFKMTLSAQSLANVSKDVNGMRSDFSDTISDSVTTVTPDADQVKRQEDIAAFKALLETALEKKDVEPAPTTPATTPTP